MNVLEQKHSLNAVVFTPHFAESNNTPVKIRNWKINVLVYLPERIFFT